MKGFKEFLLRGNVVDMAVGIVIGAAFGTVIASFVKDLMTPFIAAVVRAPDFSKIAFTLNGSKFMIGNFLNGLISFVLIAAVVYFGIVLPVNKLVERAKGPAAPVVPTTRPCSECLSDIPLAARRCAHCTSPVAPVAS